MGVDYRGARGSNTGDDFHELWAARHAVSLLTPGTKLKSLAVEGVAKKTRALGEAADTWDGVDCTLYYDDRVVIEQLKYSASEPSSPWTTARLIRGGKARSVLSRLARAFDAAANSHGSTVEVVLITNQPIADELRFAFERAAMGILKIPKAKPAASAADEVKLGFASGLSAENFHSFARAICFWGGAGSRFRQEEELIRSVSAWTDLEVLQTADLIRRLVANFMRPERADESITRETILAYLGVSEQHALFPCPSDMAVVTDPVPRRAVQQAADLMASGHRRLCLHGRAGAGKTTALQTLGEILPPGSLLVLFDCYGGGRHSDSNGLRHRPQDAFLQMANELATGVRLPLLLGRQQGTDYPRAFSARVDLAAQAIAAAHSGALLVIAVDAADNSISAAAARLPPESSFVADFMGLNPYATNVRLIITARTGRLESLGLPRRYQKVELDPFSFDETAVFVKRFWSAAPEDWIKDFGDLSGGIPRVQAYAFAADGPPEGALGHLLPGGKDLNQLFSEQFETALAKGGSVADLAALCAALAELPRPIPLADLAGTLGLTELALTDICGDLAPGVRLRDGLVSFADEDFEQHVRTEGAVALEEVRCKAAEWFASRCDFDAYAAQNVAPALLAAGRRAELLDLVEAEPAPSAIRDPVLRRETEIQRLRLAISACREAGDAVRALRFVLIGAEGIGNEKGLRDLLSSYPDMTATFSRETGARLILGDPRVIAAQGPLMFHILAADADRGDTVGLRQGSRQLSAWLRARADQSEDSLRGMHNWPISAADIAAETEAGLKTRGALAAFANLRRWTPKLIKLDVVRILAPKLVAERRGDLLEQVAATASKWSVLPLFVAPVLAKAACPFDVTRLERALRQVHRRGLSAFKLYSRHFNEEKRCQYIACSIMAACELLTAHRHADDLVDQVLASLLENSARRIEDAYASQTDKLDILLRAYCLYEARAGRHPEVGGVLLPRPKAPLAKPGQGGRSDYSAEQRDREMHDLLQAVLPAYAGTAAALVGPPGDTALRQKLVEVCRGINANAWRSYRDHDTRALRDEAAASLLALLAHGHDAHELMDCALLVNGRWKQGTAPPPHRLVATLCLRTELHERVVSDLSRTARCIRSLRMGAERKAEWLATMARLLKPVSPDDAQAVFNLAVDAAGDLDTEAIAQISLLERLIARGQPPLVGRISLALKFADVVQDAAIRLESNEAFPWSEAMSAIAVLHGGLALAVSCRWADEDIVSLKTTLAPAMKTLMRTCFISPAETVALTPLVEHDQELLMTACAEAGRREGGISRTLREMVARDQVIRIGVPKKSGFAALLDEDPAPCSWMSRMATQERFTVELEREGAERSGKNPSLAPVQGAAFRMWDDATLVDASALSAACEEARDHVREIERYVSTRDILSEARAAVSMRSRVAHLRALAALESGASGSEAVGSLLDALDLWRGTAAVDAWRAEELPEVILRRFPDFAAGMAWGEGMLIRALELADVTGPALQDLLLRALEAHVDYVGANLAFGVAALISAELLPDQAAGLANWYIGRLASRMAPSDSNVPSACEVPEHAGPAIARLLFSMLGDVDHRRRWRAAHCIRRLAQLGSDSVVELLDVYERRIEPAFCGRGLPFYWLAARLWSMIALRRCASDDPAAVAVWGPKLLAIAADEDLPHLLIRAHAKAASQALVASGHMTLNAVEAASLAKANLSPLGVVQSDAPRARRSRLSTPGERRFHFDQLDTVPYWYVPLAGTFADCSLEHFQDVAEVWIMDSWNTESDVWKWEREPRKFRGDIARSLSGGHGSIPTVERLSTYLEWHAMWCAAGELLQSKPLRDEEDGWGTLSERVGREMPGRDDLWAADLLGGVPLQPRYWRASKVPLDDWIAGVREADLLAELMPPDALGYVVVSAWIHICYEDRQEQTSISSALVAPIMGETLLRALQTVDDPLDYHLPIEGDEDAGVDTPPFHLDGWLCCSSSGAGFDEKDPLRGNAVTIATGPGMAVRHVCGLVRAADGSATWSTPSRAPMFLYEVWGDDDRRDRGDRRTFMACGYRLLCAKDQLTEFLRSTDRDLVVEVEVERSVESRSRYYHQEEAPSGEERHDRLYLLRGDGQLDVAEGRAGSWTPDRPAA